MTADRISRRWLSILLLTGVIAGSRAWFAKSSDDDPIDADPADGAVPLTIDDPALVKIKRELPFVPQRSHLAEVLSWKIEDIDLACRLTNAQKEKLRLAGKGDIQRFLDRAHELEAVLSSVNGPRQIERVIREWGSLKRLMTSGLFEGGSIFSKTRRQVLTTEQMAKLDSDPVDTSSPWMKDLKEAEAIASRLDRPVLIHFEAKWCGLSRKLERVMESPPVLRVLRRKFVPVSINVDQNPVLVRKYKVQSLPYILVVTTAGDTLYQSDGLKGELEFLHALCCVKNEPGQK